MSKSKRKPRANAPAAKAHRRPGTSRPRPVPAARAKAKAPAPRAAAAAGPQVPSRGKYVYCIINSDKPLRFGEIGLGADAPSVYTIHYKSLAAVVSDAPLEVLDSTRENVLAHERVNETVMHEHTVIPMSFGTIFKTREDIVELLRSAAEAFGDLGRGQRPAAAESGQPVRLREAVRGDEAIAQ